MGIKTVKDLKVYNLAFELARQVFEITKTFPQEELYSLIDQMRRSSRSAAINIRERFAKRKYKNVFIRHLNDSLGSSEETRGWLDFALACKYISIEVPRNLDKSYDAVNAMLYKLMNNWETRPSDFSHQTSDL
jgi:four helix bundle protein